MTDHIVILIIFLFNYGFFSTRFTNIITDEFGEKLLREQQKMGTIYMKKIGLKVYRFLL